MAAGSHRLQGSGCPGRERRIRAHVHVPPPDFKDGTVIRSWDCDGTGASIASDQIDVDLFNRFRCLVDATKYARLVEFVAPFEKLRTQAKAMTTEPSQAFLDKFVAAYKALGHYQAVGDPFQRTVTFVVTGRRDAALLGVEPTPHFQRLISCDYGDMASRSRRASSTYARAPGA